MTPRKWFSIPNGDVLSFANRLTRLASPSRPMKPIAFRLDRLEDRTAPAVATWDGGGADNHWTTAANWVGDVAPAPGDTLQFPAGAARLVNVNDVPAGTTFGAIGSSGFNYVLSGNPIARTNGV